MTVTTYIYHGDCLDKLKTFPEEDINIFVTSPPYNLGIKYKTYKDNKDRRDYLDWLNQIFKEIYRVLTPRGSFFLNVGSSNVDPWIAMDVCLQARNAGFLLQNNIVWVKSIYIDKTYGHFKPINSGRFTNHTHESIFHLTKTGRVPINRKAPGIGVPYEDKSNLKRWKHVTSDLRCRGNCWYIPYKTIWNKKQKGHHPAVFPEELVEKCIRLHGFDENTVICDPFAGTGTTLRVAEHLNINSIGIELDINYIDFILERK